MDSRPSLIPAQPELWDLWVWMLRRHCANIMLIATCLQCLGMTSGCCGKGKGLEFHFPLWSPPLLDTYSPVLQAKEKSSHLSRCLGTPQDHCCFSLLHLSSQLSVSDSGCTDLSMSCTCVLSVMKKSAYLDSFRTIPLALFALEFHWGILVPLESQRINTVLAQITCWSALGRCHSFPPMPPWGGDKANQGIPTQINNISQTIICVTPNHELDHTESKATWCKYIAHFVNISIVEWYFDSSRTRL